MSETLRTRHPGDYAWAKSGDETGFLSLRQHMIDSGDVASRLWDDFLSAQTKSFLMAETGLSEQDTKGLAVFLAHAHDIGKLTVTFQKKIERYSYGESVLDDLERSGLVLTAPVDEINMGNEFPHSVASRAILRRWLKNRGMKPRYVAPLADVVGAHHGIAVSPKLYEKTDAVVAQYDHPWIAAQDELLDEMAARSGFDQAIQQVRTLFRAPVISVLTGFVVVCDWCASNADAFPLETVDDQESRVTAGLQAIGLTAPWDSTAFFELDPDRYFSRAFGWDSDASARPSQTVARQVAQDIDGSGLILIEAPTGEGKTEAALAAAHECARGSGAQGVVFAAPTMATANGLFSRVIRWAQRVTGNTDVSSSYLAHSKSDLVPEYRRLKFHGIGFDQEAAGGRVVANQWMRGPKKGLLSNFVVSTVDQVLMLALQMRHSMLRHLALSGKVVIIDEVHAYDAFTSEYLKMTLRWLAAYGVPVILMSATLPTHMRGELLKAYGAKLGVDSLTDSYPKITSVTSTITREYDVPSRPDDLVAEVSLLAEGMETLREALDRLLVDGGCILIVCSTVRRAQETYSALAEHYEGQCQLHHSAFIASERAQSEAQLVSSLGPSSHRGSGRPYRSIVIATQVAEQSLDIDCDLLITDIAPVDLLIQRIGRLHRHSRPTKDRPEPLRTPRVLIRGINTWEPVPDFEAGTAAIYDQRLLLATAKIAKDRLLSSGFHRPSDVPGLVHDVYEMAGRDSLLGEPQWEEAWAESLADTRRRVEAARSRSKTFMVGKPKTTHYDEMFARYREEGSAKKSDEAGAAQVRDAEPTIEVIVITRCHEGYREWGEADQVLSFEEEPPMDVAWRLRSSTIRLPSQMTRYKNTFDAVITQLEEETPLGWTRHFLLKGEVALCLDELGYTSIAGFEVHYSADLGLEVLRTKDRI